MAVFGILLLFYPLSIGPAYRLETHGIVSHRAFSTLYAPIMATCRWEFIERIVVWYVDLWGTAKPAGPPPATPAITGPAAHPFFFTAFAAFFRSPAGRGSEAGRVNSRPK